MTRHPALRRILWLAAVALLAVLQTAPASAAEPRRFAGRASAHQKHAAIEAGRHAAPSTRGGALVDGQRRLGFEPGDDWEPSIDARGRHVYAAWTHFPIEGTLQRKRVLLQASHDGGATWGAPVIVADRPGGIPFSDQADPVVDVDVDGRVYVALLAWGYHGNDESDVWVARSDDHGATFHTARKVSKDLCEPSLEGCDKEWMVADHGHVYVGYANADSRMYMSVSHDRGATWTERVIRDLDAVVFAGGAAVDSTGRIFFAWDICTDDDCTEPVKMVVSHSEDQGVHWRHRLVATVPVGTVCPYVECGFGFFSPQIALDVDPNGVAVAAYSHPGGPGAYPIMVAQRSVDGGESWDNDATVGPRGARRSSQLFPAVVASGAGEFTITWMDDRKADPQHGTNGWHVFAARSHDGGQSWTDERRVSVKANEPQWRDNGFLFPYGDYQDVTVSQGRVVAVWGAGNDYIGPGNVYTRPIDWGD